jgi:hypothetical protein
MMLQQAGGKAWELCSKSGNDVATGSGNYVPKVAMMLQQARGRHGNCVPKVAMMLQQAGGRYGNSVQCCNIVATFSLYYS